MPDTAITADMLAVVGREGEPWPVEVDRTTIRQYARAIEYHDPVYYDVAAAHAAGYPDLPCPPGFLGRHVWMPGRLDTDTYDLPGADFATSLNGGTRTRTYRRIFAGESLTATFTWTGVRERRGGGGLMIIAESVTTYRDSAREVVAELFETTIFRN